MIKKIANSKDKKVLISNFFSLSILQGANYILPLLTLPYLVRVLGVEYFGLLAFATAIIAYFNIITDYGFNLTATREISIHRDNKEKVIKIFSSVMTIKLILMIVSFICMSILVFSFEKFSSHWEIYFLSFGTVVGQALFPIWLFQGMERMKYITYINILAKSIFTISIFIFVHEESDFWIVPLLTSIGFILAGIWSLYLVKKEFEVSFIFQDKETLKYYLIDGWHVFQQQFYVSMYGPINIIFLGLFTNSMTVGYYSIVEKILGVPLSIFSVLIQAYYPYAAKIYQNSKIAYFKQLKKLSMSFMLSSIILTIIILIFNHQIVTLVAGKTVNNEIVNILNILVFGIIFSAFGGFYTQVFVILKKAKILNKLSFKIMIFNLALSPFIIYMFGVIGLAYFVLIRQFLVISTCFKYIRKFRKEIL